MREVSCPICHASILLDTEDKKGDTVYCTYCGSPLKLNVKEVDDEEEFIAEEED